MLGGLTRLATLPSPLLPQKNFGEDSETLQAELEAFFATFGKVNVVRKRVDDKKAFKVSSLHTYPVVCLAAS